MSWPGATKSKGNVRVSPHRVYLCVDPGIKNLGSRKTGRQERRLVRLRTVEKILQTWRSADVEVVRLHVCHTRPLDRLAQVDVRRPVRRIYEACLRHRHREA